MITAIHPSSVTCLVGDTVADVTVTCQDGDVSFVFVSGNLALDFAGTLKWRRDDREELLLTCDDLAEWAVEAGVLSTPPTVSDADFGRLTELREGVYRLAVASVDGHDLAVEDVQAVNTHAAARPPRVVLTGPNAAVREGDADAVGWAIATSAIDLLTETAPVRECDGDRCTRLFVDRSRTGNRRWCGMAECGNKIKAAEYRARKKTRSPATQTSVAR